MRFLDWLFGPSEQDELGDELRAALATVTKRAMADTGGWPGIEWSLTARGCKLRGLPVGDWHFTATRLAAQGTEAQRAETVKQGSVHDGPVPKGCAQ